MTYKEIATNAGTSVEAVRSMAKTAVRTRVSVSERIAAIKWVVPITGVSTDYAVLGEGRTKAEAIASALGHISDINSAHSDIIQH